jgi:pilus assembly protein Flp/PilA
MQILSIRSLRSLYSFPRGQGLVEYALILVLVAIIVIIMLALFGGAVGNMYSNVIANL